jgi:long-chain alkane monooxygenase
MLAGAVDDADVDGFNLAYAIIPGSFEDIVQHVIPVLTDRGAYGPLRGAQA